MKIQGRRITRERREKGTKERERRIGRRKREGGPRKEEDWREGG